MTNGENNITWHANGDAPYGGPPTNPDGIVVPFPPQGEGTFAPGPADTVDGTWLFVAVRKTGNEISPEIEAFFDGFVLNKNTRASGFYSYDGLPTSLKGTAKVTGHRTHTYQLSEYWVEIGFVVPGDSIDYPSNILVPEGVVTWKQDSRKKRVQVKKSRAVSV